MAQKKKKPKVVLKKNQVIILAATIVAVCACMLTVVTLTAPKSKTDSPATTQQRDTVAVSPENLSSEAASQEASNQTMDAGVAQVIAQLEAAEKRAKEAETRAKEAEKRASKAQSDAENAQKQATAALEAQKRAAQQQKQQQTASNVGSAYRDILIVSLNAPSHGVTLEPQAKRIIFFMISLFMMLHSKAWNPPTEPPTSRSISSMPSSLRSNS